MKVLYKYLALAAIAVILGSCSFAVGRLNHKKARVVASAIWHPKSTATATRTVRSVTTARTLSPYVAKRKSLPPKPRSLTARSSRSVAPAVSRDISASTDIDYMTYTITNLDPGAGEPDISDYLDPYYPYIDVFLTPGDNYRITIDVVLLASSALAGNTVGITGYGDAAVVAVPADGSDVWVDMAVHAQGIVFKNQVAGGSMHWVDPATGSQGSQTVTASVNPQDKVFYTSDSLLYYFNQTTNSVSQWTDLTSPLPSLDPTNFVGSNATQYPTGPADAITMYAICPDPAFPGWFYVVGKNGSGAFELYVVNYDPMAVPAVQPAQWYLVDDITSYLESTRAGTGPTVVVTGITADIYGYAYVTFYNTPALGGVPISGMVEFDSYGLPGSTFFDKVILSDGSGSWTSANSIITDAMYGGSNLYLLGSASNLAGQTGGRSDVYEYDIFLNPLSANPTPVAQSYGGAVSLGSGGTLTLPNKFVGMIQGGSFFVSQMDFAGTGPDVLSKVSLDLSSVRSVP